MAEWIKPASLDEQWRRFAQMTLPDGCAAVQRREMEQAFKSGAIAILLEFRKSVEVLPLTAAANAVTRWTEEYRVFIENRIREYDRSAVRE